jgi:UDP-N-acetylmuramate--alanine ligase
VLTDIYGFGEAPRPGVSGRLVLQAILDAHPQQAVAYLPKREEIVSFLKERLRPGDLCLVLGAGDITSLPDELLGS